jgi:rhamnogalacturonan endolyase
MRSTGPVVEAVEARRLLAFGLTTTATTYVVDTGAGVTFTILKNGADVSSNTIALGDMTSFKLNGVEFAAPYSSASRYSHFESGLFDNAQVTATVDPSPTPQWIKITADDSEATAGTSSTGVIQYYLARRNDPNIYMATYAPVMKVSSTRYIAYLDRTKFPNVPDESDSSGNTGGIETADVQGHPDGTTSSKYYGESRNVDHPYHGVTGPSAGAFLFIGNREHGAGGPFWKDIDFQSGSSQVEIYNMPFSGHSLTDTFRPGLHGPYALNLTAGGAPSAIPDYSFFDDANVTGWVPQSGRGTLSGRAAGVAAGRAVTVGLSNSAAQYWDVPDASGNYEITGIKPGTYTQTLYDEELAVGTRTVTIVAGQAARADINATGLFGLNGANNAFTTYNSATTPIWRIGTFDGTPREFLNGDKITIMHPTDVRLTPWALDSTGVTNFTVGTNKDSDWPMAEWKTQVGAAPWVDTRNRIHFTLSAAQRAQQLTLRIGVTRTNSERPGVSANGGTTLFGSIVSQPDSRGLSLGNWRGNNAIYSYTFNANTLLVGNNTFDIYAISGSTFTGYFAGYHIYDALELIPTATNAAPAVTTLTLSPGNGTNVTTNASRVFGVTGRDGTNAIRGVNAVFSALRGTINNAGEYVAPSTPGTDTITVTYTNPTGATSTSTVSSSISINVVGNAPVIVVPASASPRPVYNYQTTLSVLGGDDNGEAGLSYNWSVVGTPPAAVTFGAGNNTNAGKTLTASFTKPGTYTFAVTITDASGNTTASQTSVAVMDELAYYKLDLPNGQSQTDATANQNYAVLYGKYGFPAGLNKGAVRLLGGAMALPVGIVEGVTDFTIGAWVKPDSLANWARIFDFGSGTTSYMYLTARSGTAGNGVRFGITNTGNTGEQFINGPALATGIWTHLAVTLTGNTATLYVNGLPVGSNSGVTLNPASLGRTTLNYIGESQWMGDPSFMGAIDDFRIFGRALASPDVAELARPAIVIAASATPTTTTVNANLTVTADDLTTGASTLTYTWSLVSGPAAVAFSVNGTNAARDSVATFARAGTYALRVTVTNLAGNSTTSDVVVTVVDQAAPVVTSNVFEFETSQSIAITFSEDVIASLNAEDLIVTDLSTNTPVPIGSFLFATQGVDSATWTRDLTSAGALPDGNYRVSIAPGGIADAAGNAMPGTDLFDFFVLAGDANRDRMVDFNDLLVLAQNYNQSGLTFSDGNFDYSPEGIVGFSDLLLLAQRYNQSILATKPAAVSSRKRPTDRPLAIV